MIRRPLAVKAVPGTTDLIEGLGMPFGGPFNGKDVEGEFFSARTDFSFDWFGERPLIYHHGLDAPGTSVVGRVKAYEIRDDGVWVKAQLDRGSRYFSAIKQMLDRQALYFSSGSVSHLAQVAKSGEILRWPWVELSLTPTPANPLAKLDYATAKAHLKAAGIAWREAPQTRTIYYRAVPESKVPGVVKFFAEIALEEACRATHLCFRPKLVWVEETADESEALATYRGLSGVRGFTSRAGGSENNTIYVHRGLDERQAVRTVGHETRHRYHGAWSEAVDRPEDEEAEVAEWAQAFSNDFWRARGR